MGLTASARNIYRYNVVDGGVGIIRISALNQLADVYLIILIASEKKNKGIFPPQWIGNENGMEKLPYYFCEIY